MVPFLVRVLPDFRQHKLRMMSEMVCWTICRINFTTHIQRKVANERLLYDNHDEILDSDYRCITQY